MVNRRAFTLIELMITIVIIGVIASFGIPTYTKSISRARERDAIFNLELIREAARVYIARESGVVPKVPPALADTDAINAEFYLNVIEQEGNTYSCLPINIFTCEASNPNGGAPWQLLFALGIADGKISCNAGPCPTL